MPEADREARRRVGRRYDGDVRGEPTAICNFIERFVWLWVIIERQAIAANTDGLASIPIG